MFEELNSLSPFYQPPFSMKKKKIEKKKLKKITKKPKVITRNPSNKSKDSKVRKIIAYQKKMKRANQKNKGFFTRLFGRR
jgi:hypothetical protein